jgi:hypothetical protein
MAEQKKIILFAIIIGISGIVIGSITLFYSIDGLLSP